MVAYPNFGSVGPDFIAQHGYKAALGEAALESEQNDIARQEYLLERGLRAPAIIGAQHVLGGGSYYSQPGDDGVQLTPEQIAQYQGQYGQAGSEDYIDQAAYDALTDEQKAEYQNRLGQQDFRSQFQPFVDQIGQAAVQAGTIGSTYAQNVPYYQQAGLAGLGLHQQLAGYDPTTGTFDQDAVRLREQNIANEYAKQYGEGAYNLAAKDINRDAQTQNWNQARQQGRFGALSSQKARGQAYIDQARTDALLQAAERANQVGYDRAQTDFGRRQSAANTLASQAATGLSHAQQGTQLATSGAQAGIQAPWAPYNAYSAAIGQAPTVSQPNYGSVTDPYTTGLGLGLQAWGNQ